MMHWTTRLSIEQEEYDRKVALAALAGYRVVPSQTSGSAFYVLSPDDGHAIAVRIHESEAWLEAYSLLQARLKYPDRSWMVHV